MEERALAGNVPIPPQYTPPSRSLSTNAPGEPPVVIQPTTLVFKASPICIPAVAIIDLINRSPDKDLQLLQVTAGNPQFYPAMFKPQILQPMGRTSLQVIFLPRTLGTIETTITVGFIPNRMSNRDGNKLTSTLVSTYILSNYAAEYTTRDLVHPCLILLVNLMTLPQISTSEGDISYPVQAHPTQNVYRITPIVGSKVPAGVPNVRPIVIYNPHNEILHILEIFTTESFLNIIIPDTEDQGDGRSLSAEGGPLGPVATVWTIPPKSEKEIVKLAFR